MVPLKILIEKINRSQFSYILREILFERFVKKIHNKFVKESLETGDPDVIKQQKNMHFLLGIYVPSFLCKLLKGLDT